MFGLLALILVGVGVYAATSSDSEKKEKKVKPIFQPPGVKTDVDAIFSRDDVKARVARGQMDGGVEEIASSKQALIEGWDEKKSVDMSYLALVLYGHSRDVDASGSFDDAGKLVGMTYVPITDSTAPLSDLSASMVSELAERFFDRAVEYAPVEKAEAVAATLESEMKSIEEAHNKAIVVKTGKAKESWASFGTDVASSPMLAQGQDSSVEVETYEAYEPSVDEQQFAVASVMSQGTPEYLPYEPEPPAYSEQASGFSVPMAQGLGSAVSYAPSFPTSGASQAPSMGSYVPVTGYLSFGEPMPEYDAAQRLESRLYQCVEEDAIGSTGYQADPYTYV